MYRCCLKHTTMADISLEACVVIRYSLNAVHYFDFEYCTVYPNDPSA